MIDLTTPALLFPAVSLLLLAYTNRFLGLSALIRELYHDYRRHPDTKILKQIGNLRLRITLIKWTQFLGVSSLLLCVLAMCQIVNGWFIMAAYSFGTSLLFMSASLTVSLVEIAKSSKALNILLADLEANHSKPRRHARLRRKIGSADEEPL